MRHPLALSWSHAAAGASHRERGDGWVLVGPTAFKAAVRRAERLGCVRFARISATSPNAAPSARRPRSVSRFSLSVPARPRGTSRPLVPAQPYSISRLPRSSTISQEVLNRANSAGACEPSASRCGRRQPTSRKSRSEDRGAHRDRQARRSAPSADGTGGRQTRRCGRALRRHAGAPQQFPTSTSSRRRRATSASRRSVAGGVGGRSVMR